MAWFLLPPLLAVPWLGLLFTRPGWMPTLTFLELPTGWLMSSLLAYVAVGAYVKGR